MYRDLLLVVLIPLFWQESTAAQPPQAAPFVELLEDDVEPLLRQLQKNPDTTERSEAFRELRDVFSGAISVRATSLQRYRTHVQGWNFAIAQDPQPGQYRFLRFAWKRTEGARIMFQLFADGRWEQRYYAGEVTLAVKKWGAMINVAAKPPRDWQVVTRDLFQDFGAITITGVGLSPLEGTGYGLFDHVYLGRTTKDLDQATAEAFGKIPLKERLEAKELDKMWADLAGGDVKLAGSAMRRLVAGRKDSVAFLKNRVQQQPEPIDLKRVARLIAALDDDNFDVREKASKELQDLGATAVRPLQQARLATKSPEQRERLDELLRKNTLDDSGLTSDQMRTLRVIRILEWSGTTEAQAALRELSLRALDAGLNAYAKEALERLAKLPAIER